MADTVRQLEDAELLADASGQGAQAGEARVRLMAAYLAAEGGVDRARHLWKRLPEEERRAGGVAARLWEVTRALWVQDHAAAVGELERGEWPPELEALLAGVAARCRGEAERAVGKAYSSLDLPACASLLRLGTDACAARARELGWRVDEARGAVYPQPLPSADPVRSREERMHQLTEYAAHLDE